MKKVIIIICILLLIFIIFNFNLLKTIVENMIYFNKANENYVSKTYNINITSKEQMGKNYVFYGKEKETNEDVFVFFVYGKGIHQVYGNEGINKEKALQIFNKYKNDVTTGDLYIIVRDSFVKGENIRKYLYWVIEKEGKFNHSHVSFIDGVYYK